MRPSKWSATRPRSSGARPPPPLLGAGAPSGVFRPARLPETSKNVVQRVRDSAAALLRQKAAEPEETTKSATNFVRTAPAMRLAPLQELPSPNQPKAAL